MHQRQWKRDLCGAQHAGDHVSALFGLGNDTIGLPGAGCLRHRALRERLSCPFGNFVTPCMAVLRAAQGFEFGGSVEPGLRPGRPGQAL